MPRHKPFSALEHAAMIRVPVDRESFARYYTFSSTEKTWIERHNGDHNRLGFAVLLCYMKFPGLVPEQDAEPDKELLTHVCDQLSIHPDRLGDYSKRQQTRREHAVELQSLLDVRSYKPDADRPEALKALEDIALETTRGAEVLARLIAHLRSRKRLLPGFLVLRDICAEAITKGEETVNERLDAGLSVEHRRALERMLLVPEGQSVTPFTWVRQPAAAPSPKWILQHIKKLNYIRDLKLPQELWAAVPSPRLRRLAALGARKSVQHYRNLEERARYAMLAAVVLQTEVALKDQIVNLNSRIVGSELSRTKRDHEKQFVASKPEIRANIAAFALAGRALKKARSKKRNAFRCLDAVIKWDELMRHVAWAENYAKEEGNDELSGIIDAYNRIHRYAGAFLDALEFTATPAAKDVYSAAMAVKRIHHEGNVPSKELPREFLKPKKWRRLVLGDDEKDFNIRYYEILAMVALRAALESGDIWVVGSRHFAEFESLQLPKARVIELTESDQLGLAPITNLEKYLEPRLKALRYELPNVNRLAAADELPGVILRPGLLKISPNESLMPPGAKEFAQSIHRRLRRIKITDLLLETHAATNFASQLTHIENGAPPPPNKLRAVLTALLAQALNLGPAKMAEACPGVTIGELLWAYDTYVREETFPAALAVLTNSQHKLEVALNWGDGTTSSSDAVRLRTGGRASKSGDYLGRYGPEPSRLFMSWVSDQCFPYAGDLICNGFRDGRHLLTGILGHESDLNIKEHYTDTLGFTDHMFAEMPFFWVKFAPRIRDFSTKRLYFPPDFSAAVPCLEWMKGGVLNPNLITENWGDVIRLFASIRWGTVSSSLANRKLSNQPRQHNLALALTEMGRLERTLYMLEWLQSPELRRRTQIGLNKGEVMHGLQKAVFHQRAGDLRDRSFEDQRFRTSGLNIVVGAIVYWNTVALDGIFRSMASAKKPMDPTFLPHVSPLAWDHINLTGDYIWPKSGVFSAG